MNNDIIDDGFSISQLSSVTSVTDDDYLLISKRINDDSFESVKIKGRDMRNSMLSVKSNVINVKDFGAKGDNNTDDTDAIQAAVSASSYQTLYFPHGHYIITRKIIIDKPITIIGDNPYSSIIKTNTYNIVMFSVTANGGVVLDNLCFIGPEYWSSTETGGAMIRFEPDTENQGSIIRSCRFTYGFLALDMLRNQTFTIANCKFSKFRFCGIRVNNTYNSDHGDSIITECTISSDRKNTNVDHPNYTYGILQYGGAGLRVINNKILGTDLGIDFKWQGQNGEVSEISSSILLIESNSIEHCYQCIRIGNETSSHGFSHIIITGNEITVPMDGCGILLSKNSSDGSKIKCITIANNSFHLNVDSNNTTYPENLQYDRKHADGIIVYGGQDIFIGTNVFRGISVGIQDSSGHYVSTPFSYAIRITNNVTSATVAKQVGTSLKQECYVSPALSENVKMVGVGENFTISGTTGGEPDDDGWYSTDEISYTFKMSGGFGKIPTIVATPTSEKCRCYIASKTTTNCSVVILSKEPTAEVTAEVIAMC